MTALFLIAAIAGRPVAIPSDAVDSVIDLGPVVPVPGTPAHVLGLTALRSKVVTVIDAATALGIDTPAAAAPRAVVTTVGGHVYAIIVDRLDDVAEFAQSPLPNGVRLDPAWSAVARGIVSRAGEGVLVIDPAALVAAADTLVANNLSA